MCRANHSLWCLLCPAAPERRQTCHLREGVAEDAGVRPWGVWWGKGRGAQGRRDFLTSDVLVTRQPGWQPLQGQPCRPPAAGTWPSFGNSGWEGRWGRKQGPAGQAVSHLGAHWEPEPPSLPVALGLLPLGRVFTLGAHTLACNPPSPPGSSAVVRSDQVQPFQCRHTRQVFCPNTLQLDPQPLV